MGIELPDELAEVAAATGLSWPQADEDRLREQANAWREAKTKLTTLATEADHAANGAVGAMSGPAAEAAGKQWSGFVDPDHGSLTSAARGAGEAAARLDHAADQVGAAKVEMVRRLVDASKNRDAAETAASSGHPTALLGLDTVLRGTATNLSAVTHGLAGAVGPGGGSPVSAVADVVNPHPGAHTQHGQAGLLSVATGLPATALSTVDNVAVPVVTHAAGAVDQVASPVAGHAASAVAPVAGHAVDAVDQAVDSTVDTGRQALPPQPPHPGPYLPDPAADLGTGPIRLPEQGQPGPPPPLSEPATPVALPQQAASPQYGGFLENGGFDDVPTPATGMAITPAHGTPAVHHAPGTTVASGFTDAAYSPPPAAAPAPGYGPGPAPAMPPPAPAAPQPGYVPPSFGGAPAPGGGAPPMPPPIAGAAPAAPVAPGFPPRQQSQGAGGFRYAPVAEPQPYAAPRPEAPRQEAPRPVPAAPPLGAPRQERESIVALFLVHMFPIGHLPVAADRPARQLPIPPAEVDYAPGLRFPPHDHPRSVLIDSSDALEKVRAGLSRLPTPPTLPPDQLTEGYDPLGGLHERDWDRRFLAAMRDSIPEYAWPPGEQYPEGGCEPGTPELLPEGTLLDRFGECGGRVFAPAGTPFAQRSLPPSMLEGGYRRYRVLRELPMWQALSAGWFGQPGGGVRYRAIYSADELITMGYLADTTFEEGQ